MFLTLSKIQIINTLLIALALPLVIVSCGGSDSGSTTAPANAETVTTAVVSNQDIAISSSNSSQIANQSYSSTGRVGDITALQTPTTTIPIAAQVSATVSKQTVMSIAKKVFRTIDQNRSNGASVIGVTVTCTDGGTASVTPDLPASGPISGTTYTFSFSNCKEGIATTNGGIVYAGTVSTDTTGNLTNLDATFRFNQFSYSDAQTAVAINGGFTILLGTNAGVTTFSFKTTSPSNVLSFRDAVDAFELSNFDITLTSDAPNTVTTYSINYTVSTPDGRITVTTPALARFEQAFNKPYPYQGVVVVTGAVITGATTPTKVRLTVDSGGVGDATDTVTIEVDPTGAGYDQALTQNKIWSQL